MSREWVEPNTRKPQRSAAEEDDARVAAVEALCDRSLFLQAQALAEPLGPLAKWTGTRGRLVAARLASHLGAPALARRLALAAYHHDPGDWHARAAVLGIVLDSRGPLEVWTRTEHIRIGELPAEAAAEIAGMRALAAVFLRDFDAAGAVLDEADAAGLDDALLQMRRSAMLEAQDRYDEALELARRARERWPGLQGAWRWLAHMLVLVGRRDEAIAELSAASTLLESANVLWALAALQASARQHDARAESLRRYAELSPMLEDEPRGALEAALSDTAYRRGDVEAAITHARRSKRPAFARIADRLAERRPDRRVLLDVPFVRQHRLTCVPATLAALGRFWERPAEHLAIAEAICFDGTPAHSERLWAEENGWAARELRVTWDAITALLDRGIPVALHTQGPTSGHCQAIIGHDARRGTMTIRDPFIDGDLDVFGEELIEEQRASGPRGLAIVPADRAGLLEGLDLPDTALYDRHHALHRALDAHDRAAAGAEAEALAKEAPDHVVTLAARRALAAYDGHFPDLYANARRALELFPRSARARLDVLAALRELGTRDERVAFLEPICAEEDCEPIFHARLAAEIGADARRLPRAERLARRAVRSHPGAEALTVLASILMRSRDRREQALECLRFAACAEDRNERFAQSFFSGALSLGRTRAEEALAWLEARFRRFGQKAPGPAVTLAWALEQLDHAGRAFEVLAEALRLLPDDGELALAAAETHARHGDLERAKALLAQAEGKAPRTDWLLSAARIARHGEAPGARIALYRQVLEAAPLSLEAHAALVELLSAEQGRGAAAQHLAAATARFPRATALRTMRVEHLRDDSPAEHEAAVRELLAIEPSDAWAHRELALALGDQRRFDEARAAAAEAERLAPAAAATWFVWASLCTRAGDVEGARRALWKVLEQDADSASAVSGLLGLPTSPEARARDVEEIAALLERRSISGEGVLAWMPAARPYLAPEALHARLSRLREARPELWAVWLVCAEHLVDLGRAGEADALLRDAIARFSHVPALRLAAADLHAARGDAAAELEAIERAVELSPLDAHAIVRHAGAIARHAGPAEAMEVLERAARRLPLDPQIAHTAALFAWRAGRREEAIERVERLAALHPGEHDLWALGFQWRLSVSGADRALARLREAAAARGHDAGLRCVLADSLSSVGRPDLALTVAGEAIAIEPDCAAAHDLRGRALLQMGREGEAAAAYHPPIFGARRPVELRLHEAAFHADRGDLLRAIQIIEDVLRERPGDARGFSLLARCQQLRGDPQRALLAAQELVRLAPRSADAHRLLAEARLEIGARAAAVASYRRALALSPGELRSAAGLFDLHRQDGDVAAAASVLAQISRTAPATSAALGVELAILRDDGGGALEQMRALCTAPAPAPGQLWAARAALIHAGLADRAHELLASLLSAPEASPEVGRIVARTWVVRGDRRSGLERLGELDPSVPAARTAAIEAVTVAMPAWRAWHHVTVLWRHRARLRAHVALWAAVGQVLAALGKRWAAVLWLEDHAARERPPAATLWALSTSLAALGLTRRANEVSERALTEAEPDEQMRAHLTRAAFRRALEGDTAGAAERLSHVDAGALDPKALGLYHLAALMLDVQRAPAELRAGMLPAAKQRLGLLPHDPDWFHARRRVVKDVGTFGAFAWVHWAPWMIGPVCALFALAVEAGSLEKRIYVAVVIALGVPISAHLYHAGRRLWSRL